MVLNKHIKETKIFIESHPIVKRIILSKTNLLAIKKGYKVANRIGFDKWGIKTNSSINNKEIIKELINKNKH